MKEMDKHYFQLAHHDLGFLRSQWAGLISQYVPNPSNEFRD
jgi:hypothetical protein